MSLAGGLTIITIKPGKPFWLFFVAFVSNMIFMFGVDTLTITADDIQVSNWWVAAFISALVGGAVYGKAKVDELGGGDSSDTVEEP